MYKGVFGFSVWFYGAIAMLLAVCNQLLLLGGLLAFVFMVEKDEWLNRQVMQAFLMALSYSAIVAVTALCSSVFIIVPFFGWGISGVLTGLVSALTQILVICLAIRAFSRMHKGLDSDIPIIANFVNSLF